MPSASSASCSGWRPSLVVVGRKTMPKQQVQHFRTVLGPTAPVGLIGDGVSRDRRTAPREGPPRSLIARFESNDA
jgi:hypothetical protein